MKRGLRLGHGQSKHSRLIKTRLSCNGHLFIHSERVYSVGGIQHYTLNGIYAALICRIYQGTGRDVRDAALCVREPLVVQREIIQAYSLSCALRL